MTQQTDNREKIVDSLNQSIESWHEALGSSGAIIGGSDLDPVEQTFGEFACNRLPAAPAVGGSVTISKDELDDIVDCFHSFKAHEPYFYDKYGYEDTHQRLAAVQAALAGGPVDGEGGNGDG